MRSRGRFERKREMKQRDSCRDSVQADQGGSSSGGDGSDLAPARSRVTDLSFPSTLTPQL